MEQLLNVHQASEVLGIKPATLYKYVMLRSVPFTKVGARVLFRPSCLEAWIEERSIPARDA